MMRWTLRAAAALVAAALLSSAPSAHAIPAFARKYGTSCLTCHTVYPRLNPFGEAFRRNGYLFPGIDSDFVKQETVALGQEAAKKQFPNAVWPGWVPSIPGLAFGANGTLITHPTTGSDAAIADNGAQFSLDNIIAEAHVWAGGAISDSITVWGELTVVPGGAELERAEVLFNDLFGPRHLFNVTVGRGVPTLTAFGPHATYLSDSHVVNVPLIDVYNDPATAGASWQLNDNFNLVELNGIAGGRVEYGVGLNAGSHVSAVKPSENVYGHLAFKLGGMRMDGEGSTGSTDVAHPWAETALTVYGFASHSNTEFDATVVTDATTTPVTTATLVTQDVAKTFGGGGRAQAGSLELDFGGYWDRHNHVTPALLTADGRPGEVTSKVLWGELSYILYPWLVPAVRVEHVILSPTGGISTNDTRIIPGVAFLIRPNVKFIVTGVLERASGLPDAGGSWGGAGGTVVPADPNTSAGVQLASVNGTFGFAF